MQYSQDSKAPIFCSTVCSRVKEGKANQGDQGHDGDRTDVFQQKADGTWFI